MLACDLHASCEGRTVSGYDAYAWIARRVFLLWPLAVILSVPFVADLGRRTYHRFAGYHREERTSRKSRETAAVPEAYMGLIHGLGLVLLVGQLSISGFMLLYNLQDTYLPSNAPHLQSVRWLVNGIGKRRPQWPFDLYPTYTPATPSGVHVWEAYWVTSDGKEVRVSPNAYFKLSGNSGLTWSIVTDLYWNGNAAEVRERSLDLTRLLWRNESSNIRNTVTAVSVYFSDYRLEAPTPLDRYPALLVGRKLLYTFPASLLSSGPASTLPAEVGADATPSPTTPSQSAEGRILVHRFRVAMHLRKTEFLSKQWGAPQMRFLPPVHAAGINLSVVSKLR
jgi:hypothetical protein